MSLGGLPANFTFKRRKGKKVKARRFDIGAQLRKEAQPVKIEKTEEEKAAEQVTTTSDWQEDQPENRSRNSFKSNFGSIQRITEGRKKPQEHVLKRKTREDGRAIIQNVIMAAKEGKKKQEPEKEETKPKLGVYRPGGWMARAKKKQQFEISEAAFPAMNPNAAPASSAPAVAAKKSVWAPAAKPAETAEKPVAKPEATATTKSATDQEADDTPAVPAPTTEAPPVPPAEVKVTPPKKNKFKKKKKKKKKKVSDGAAAPPAVAPTEKEVTTSAEPAAADSTPAASEPEVQATVVKKKKTNKFKKKKKKKKKQEDQV